MKKHYDFSGGVRIAAIKASKGKASIHKRKVHPLAELLRVCDSTAPIPEEAIAWDNMPLVGNEII